MLAARKVRDERGNRTNLYCVGIAPSGAGKDHARKVNKNVLFQAGLNEHDGNEDLASDAGLVTAVEQQPAVLFQIDEFGRFLRTIGDPNRHQAEARLCDRSVIHLDAVLKDLRPENRPGDAVSGESSHAGESFKFFTGAFRARARGEEMKEGY